MNQNDLVSSKPHLGGGFLFCFAAPAALGQAQAVHRQAGDLVWVRVYNAAAAGCCWLLLAAGGCLLLLAAGAGFCWWLLLRPIAILLLLLSPLSPLSSSPSSLAVATEELQLKSCN